MTRPRTNVDLKFRVKAESWPWRAALQNQRLKACSCGLRPLRCSFVPRRMTVTWRQPIANRRLVHPPAAVGNQNWQFFHHELRLTEGADHVRAGRCEPFLRHFLTGMTAPALDICVTREDSSIDFSKIAVVQPGLTSAFNVVAVIEHEAGAVRMAEIFKANDFHLVTRLAAVQVVDHFVPGTEPNQVDIKFVADRTD